MPKPKKPKHEYALSGEAPQIPLRFENVRRMAYSPAQAQLLVAMMLEREYNYARGALIVNWTSVELIGADNEPARTEPTPQPTAPQGSGYVRYPCADLYDREFPVDSEPVPVPLRK